jgi:hypothetical protein
VSVAVSKPGPVRFLAGPAEVQIGSMLTLAVALTDQRGTGRPKKKKKKKIKRTNAQIHTHTQIH